MSPKLFSQSLSGRVEFIPVACSSPIEKNVVATFVSAAKTSTAGPVTNRCEVVPKDQEESDTSFCGDDVLPKLGGVVVSAAGDASVTAASAVPSVSMIV